MKRLFTLISIALIAIAIAACGKPQSPPPGTTIRPIFRPLPSATPTPPVAVFVNETPVFRQTVDAQLAQFARLNPPDSRPDTLTENAVVSGLIDQTLMAQLAAENTAATIPDAAVNEKLSAMEASVPAEQFSAWLARNNLSAEELRATLRGQLMAAQLFEAITQSVPTTADQIHAQCLQLPTQADAERVKTAIAEGATFADFAAQYACTDASRRVGADLGWFPAGVNVLPAAVEAEAFTLPVETPTILPAADGFYVLRVSATATERALTPEFHYRLRVVAFENWFNRRRATAKIEWMSN